MVTTESKHSQTDISRLMYDAGVLVMESINNDNITEIMLNPDGYLFVEHREKGMYSIGSIPKGNALNFIYTTAGIQGKTINSREPYLECELPFERARFEATIPPVTEKPAFTIRKRAKEIYTMSDYLNSGIITENQAKAVKQAIEDKKNILICGAPGTGKTTFANACIDALSMVCDDSERIITIEDVPELQCKSNNLLNMYTDSKSGVSINTLLRITLRSRPDRILVGEVRDGAMLELLKAWNVGCSGIATVHSNTATAQSAMQRCMDLSLEVSKTAPVGLITETINMIVTIDRAKNKSGRIINSVAVVKGVNASESTHNQFKFNFEYIK